MPRAATETAAQGSGQGLDGVERAEGGGEGAEKETERGLGQAGLEPGELAADETSGAAGQTQPPVGRTGPGPARAGNAYAAAPAREVVKVAASVTGAMRARGMPLAARIGPRSEPPPIP